MHEQLRPAGAVAKVTGVHTSDLSAAQPSLGGQTQHQGYARLGGRDGFAQYRLGCRASGCARHLYLR